MAGADVVETEEPPKPRAVQVKPFGLSGPINQCIPGYTGPGTVKAGLWSSAARICGPVESRELIGQVALVTGASRGIGKGIAHALAEAGAIVYVTGRSTAAEVTDPLLGGTVKETVSAFAKLGGNGVAVRADHAQHSQNTALAKLITSSHGRLDVLVNNAFYLPKPDVAFFETKLWDQPIRFLHEQAAVGGLNHAEQTLFLLPALRRGKGLVVNVSSWGSQTNIPTFPASYLASKAALDRASASLAEQLREYHVSVLTLWPGKVRNERMMLAAQKTNEEMSDWETPKFTGQAVVQLAKMSQESLFYFTKKNRTLSAADLATYDTDAYEHEGNLHTFLSGGQRS